MSLLQSLGGYCATQSINIPRLWRSGIREFASSIKCRTRPQTGRLNKSPHTVYAIANRYNCGARNRRGFREIFERPSRDQSNIDAKTKLKSVEFLRRLHRPFLYRFNVITAVGNRRRWAGGRRRAAPCGCDTVRRNPVRALRPKSRCDRGA